MEEIATEISGSFTFHQLAQNSITVPFIEDNDNTLIIRTSYDTTAIVDEEYTKDKVNFERVIQNTTFSANVYYSSSVDTDLNIDQLDSLHTTLGSTPNYIVKSRFPNSNILEYPKFYKIDS